MSVTHTEAAVRARTKTVTRRLGWTFLRPGDRLTLCRKVMGRKPGEPLVRLAEVEVVSVRRERLDLDFTDAEVAREGVPLEAFTLNEHEAACPSCRPVCWVDWFARTMSVPTSATVTRIEWRYLDDQP